MLLRVSSNVLVWRISMALFVMNVPMAITVSLIVTLVNATPLAP